MVSMSISSTAFSDVSRNVPAGLCFDCARTGSVIEAIDQNGLLSIKNPSLLPLRIQYLLATVEMRFVDARMGKKMPSP